MEPERLDPLAGDEHLGRDRGRDQPRVDPDADVEDRAEVGPRPVFQGGREPPAREPVQDLDESGMPGLVIGPRLTGALRVQVEPDFAPDGRGERGYQLVIVKRGDGVELVVVASGAADGQAEHRRAEGGGHVVELVVPLLLGGIGGDLRAVDARREEAGCHQGLRIVGLDLVARQLEPDEAVVGHVFIQGPDDKVAVVVGARPVVVVLVAVALGEPGQVEPVPCPSLAVTPVGQEPVDDLGEGVGRGVGDERLDVLGGWGQADEVERGAADQGPATGRRVGGDPSGVELDHEESVDRRPAPGVVRSGAGPAPRPAAGTPMTGGRSR